jgi:hypothetical protein
LQNKELDCPEKPKHLTPAFAQPQTVYPKRKWTKNEKLPKISYRESYSDVGDSSGYKEFGREVSGIISKMKEVASGREKDDLRVLEFRLREYNQAVSNRDWGKANSIRDSLGVQLNRGSAVAADAGRRKAEAASADAERRHRELMAQKERQHREAMARQKALEDQIRIINSAPRNRVRPNYGW